jgi:hypothetical protein
MNTETAFAVTEEAGGTKEYRFPACSTTYPSPGGVR